MISQQISRFATHENSAYPSLWRGCVGAWCPSLGPSGARLHDYSRRMNWGTLTNMDPATDWVVSNGAYALDFDGINDIITVDRIPAIESQIELTISFWAKWQLNGSSLAGFFSYGQNGVFTNDIFLYYISGAYNLQVNNGADGALSFTAAVPSAWTHYAMRYRGNATSIEFFLDGAPRTLSGTFSPPSTSATGASLSLWWGGYIASSSGWFLSGQLDDMRIYHRSLSNAEILLLSRRRGIAFTPRTRARGTPEQAAGGATNTLTVSNATLNLTGQSSSLVLSRKLLASNGSLNLAGQTSSLSLSRSLSTAKADLNISGQSSLLQVARLLSASNGTIEFSGQSADLRLFRNLSVNNASLSLSGQSATIYAARSLTVDHADVNLSGQVVTLSAGKTLTVNNGEIQFVGQQVILTTQRNLTIVNTDISLSGQSVSMKLTTQQNLTVSNAGIEVQGQQVTLRLAKSLVVLPAEIQSSGQTAQLTVARKLAVQDGDVDLAGQDVMVRRRFELGIGEGQVSFSGEGIGLLSSRKILATEGRVQFFGQAVQIYPTFQNPVQIFGGNLRFIDKTTGSLRFIQEITR